jgi:hypothetical protein
MAIVGVFAGGKLSADTETADDGTTVYKLRITGASGGGPATVADGADVAEGATTDAVVAAGAAGTVSAKLRRLTTDLDAFKTANHADLISATPAGTNLIGKVGLDQTTNGTTNATTPKGLYTASPGTLSTGNYSALAIDVNSNLQVRLMALGANLGDAVPAANVGLVRDQANANNLMLSTVQNSFNGSTYDRVKKANAASRLLSSAATTNATSVKASAGDLFKIAGNNTVASKRYLKLYNKASAPTVGSDTPVLTFVLPLSAPFAIDLGATGQYFSTGIAYAITGAAADADTTALGAGDIECLNLTYA